MDLLLLYRFHFVPLVRALAEAVRRGPLVFGVAGFLVVFLAGLTAAGKPVLILPADGVQAAASAAAVTLVLAVLFWRAGTGGRWALFFQARPRGRRARTVYLAARALGVWAAASLTVWGLSGQGAAVAAAGLAAGPFTLLAVGLSLRTTPTRPGRGRAARFHWLPAWWLSQPLLFWAPPAAWLALMVWAVSGQAGFVWAERPPVAALLLDFGWPTLIGLLWSDAGSRLPLGYFRLARAPFRRVLAVVGAPVAASTLLVLAAVAWWSWPDALRPLVLTLTGTAFWCAFWLRSGRATLAHLALFVTSFLIGAALERDWWPLWAAVQAGGAGLALAGWRTRYYEGETHAGN